MFLWQTGLYPHMTQWGKLIETYMVEKLSGVFGRPDFPEGKGYLAGGF